jgi:hypothetical protein
MSDEPTPAALLAQGDGGAEAGLAVRHTIEIHQRHFVAPALQHRDPRLHEALAFLRGGVLSVLAQVAELAGALDLFRELRIELALEAGNLVVKPLENSFFHWFSR